MAAGVELDLGQRSPATHGAPGQPAVLQQRLRLPLPAARRLEEALVELLDALQALPAR